MINLRAFLFLLIFVVVFSGMVGAAPPTPETFTEVGINPIPKNPETPDITFTDSQGKSHSLSQYKGKVVLLNFWATWCPPCRAEIPSMDRLNEAMKGTDFVMIPINIQEPMKTVKDFVKKKKIGFPIYYDLKGIAAQIIGVRSIPLTLLIDREGRVQAVVNGAFEWDSQDVISLFKDWAEKI